MPARSGGRYEIRNNKPVLVERTGYTPDKEQKSEKQAKASPSTKEGDDAVS